MADPIEFEWYGPVEGNDALLRDLQRFTERYGEAAIFVRRLSWVPLNYPCQIDDGVAFPAERILEQTSEDLQVLCGYWTDVVDLIGLFQLLDVGTADLEIYSSQGPNLLGSLGYFEWYVRRWSVAGDLWNLEEPSQTTESASGVRKLADRAKYIEHSFVPSHGSRTSLNPEGLSVARCLSLGSAEKVMRGHGVSRSYEEPELTKVFDWALQHAHFVSEDWFKDGELGHLSSISRVNEAPFGVDVRLATPWGTFFCFDERWNLILSATKRSTETQWRVVHLSVK